MRYYIIAGERSGDMHAGNLARAIVCHDAKAVMKGFGGENMQSAGVDLTVHYRELAFMGFAEVLSNLNKISRFIKQCKEDILAFKPDVIILVDYGGFNTRIAKFGRKNGIKVFFYISPKVWAWYQSRARTLKANVDRMFVILPFEKDFYKKFDWEVDYVGNPVLDAVQAHRRDESFPTRHGIDVTKPIIAMLPGSRKQELLNVTNLMAGVAKHFPEYQFAVAKVDNLPESLYQEFVKLSNVVLVQNDTYNLLSFSTAAVVTSGTATLETCLLKVPQIVVYKTSFISYSIAKSFIKVPFISLVNLIAGKKVISEFIQKDMNEENVVSEIDRLINNKSYREKMLLDYDSIYKTLDIGSASENAAKLMIGYLRSRD